MNNLLKNLEFKVYTSGFKKSVEGGRRLIRGYASVGDVLDRQNEVIVHSALVGAKNDLMENITVFFNHNHSDLPIGKTVAAEIDENGLLVTVEISKAPSAESIWTLIQEGILNSFSIGGRVLDADEKRDKNGNIYNEITKIELFEVSVVGLPANQEAKFALVKSFNMAITKEIRKKGGRVEMAEKDIKKEEPKVDEVVETEGTTAEDVETKKTDEEAPKVEEEEAPKTDEEEAPKVEEEAQKVEEEEAPKVEEEEAPKAEKAVTDAEDAEEEIVRKSDVIIAPAPYEEDSKENKISSHELNKLKEQGWAKLIYGK